MTPLKIISMGMEVITCGGVARDGKRRLTGMM